MYKVLSKIWSLFQSNYKWHILWLFHDKFMLGVSGVIFDADGNVLLLKHRFWKKNSWGLPSGYTQKNEMLEDGLKRELKEETNLDVSINKLFNINSGFKLRVEFSYIGFCGVKDTILINEKEILEANFFSPNHLPEGLLESHSRLIAIAVQHNSR